MRCMVKKFRKSLLVALNLLPPLVSRSIFSWWQSTNHPIFTFINADKIDGKIELYHWGWRDSMMINIPKESPSNLYHHKKIISIVVGQNHICLLAESSDESTFLYTWSSPPFWYPIFNIVCSSSVKGVKTTKGNSDWAITKTARLQRWWNIWIAKRSDRLQRGIITPWPSPVRNFVFFYQTQSLDDNERKRGGEGLFVGGERAWCVGSLIEKWHGHHAHAHSQIGTRNHSQRFMWCVPLHCCQWFFHSLIAIDQMKLTKCVGVEQGECFSWGYGLFGRLGLGNELSSDVPQKIPKLSKVTHLSCGYSHTLTSSLLPTSLETFLRFGSWLLIINQRKKWSTRGEKEREVDWVWVLTSFKLHLNVFQLHVKLWLDCLPERTNQRSFVWMVWISLFFFFFW